jgi:hypothetical protein
LSAGDIGTAVLVHEGGKGRTLEFMTLDDYDCRRHAAGQSDSAN